MGYTVYDLATLANAVYYWGQTVVGEWKRVAAFGDHKEGGFYGALYKRDVMSVLAYRGTDDPWDVSPDAEIALGQVPGQMPNAELALSRAKRSTGTAPLAVTGHSLGGALACLIAAKAGLPCVTFNAPGVARSYAASFRVPILQGLIPFASAPEVAFGMVKAASLDTSRIINIRANYDVVSIGTGPRLGRVDNIAVAGCKPVELEKRTGAISRGEPLPGVMAMEGAATAVDLAVKSASYVVCQHGMELMEQQIRNMPEYHRDLDW